MNKLTYIIDNKISSKNLYFAQNKVKKSHIIKILNPNNSLFHQFNLYETQFRTVINIEVAKKCGCDVKDIILLNLDGEEIRTIFVSNLSEYTFKFIFTPEYLNRKKLEIKLTHIQKENKTDIRQLIYDCFTQIDKLPDPLNLKDTEPYLDKIEELKLEYYLKCYQIILSYLDDDKLIEFITNNVKNIEKFNTLLDFHPDNPINKIKENRCTQKVFSDDT